MTATHERITDKAEGLVATGGVIKADGCYFVRSSTYPGTYYRVALEDGKPTCSCPWSTGRDKSPCSHMLACGIAAQSSRDHVVPMGVREAELIMDEQRNAEAKAVAESLPVINKSASVFDVFKKLSEGSKCPTCGKSTLQANLKAMIGMKGVQLERISAETHCTCEGGIAHHLVKDGAA